ncbi:hypothetical protein Pan181_45610 [Aeoliella mucimassa]|uniref:Uncharacterized protein n=1 Tax=Aeoliella mucimassa TaxID=2527972 RepID=A0A518AUC7_9BACT|nr:hypothetical protein Pan181_45610 [Aeoliella mucimassa]
MTPFMWWAEHWWYGMTIAIVFHFFAWFSKGGRWSSWWSKA